MTLNAKTTLDTFTDRAAKKEVLKDIIRDLHRGGDVEVLKKRFADLVHDVSGAEIGAMEQELIAAGSGGEGLVLDTGTLSAEQVNLMLTRLPVDISFVDESDTVVYYSATAERAFPRTPGVIGRKVQNCHPPESLAVVERILNSFKSGERDEAEFWIESRGKFIHIRYFAMRDREGNYRGTLEVTQDVTAIRALRGERRLLDGGRQETGEI
jgi:PAS domain S-box-containing protein